MRHALMSFLVVISDDQTGTKAVVLAIKGARSISSLFIIEKERGFLSPTQVKMSTNKFSPDLGYVP